VRPLLLPALRRLWRDQRTLQLGVDPGHAVVLADVDLPTAGLLDLLDGRHSVGELRQAAERAGLGARAAAELVEVLARCGAVVDGEPVAALPVSLPPETRRRLAPEVAALSLTAGAAAGRVVATRSRRSVVVHGACRLGAPVAALLAASGVGRVTVTASGTVTAEDASPAGLLPGDEHRPRATAASEAVRRAAPGTDTRPPGHARRPDLVVLAGQLRPAVVDAVAYAARAVPHLPLWVRDGTAVVGPLVVPGHSSCLQCVDLHRTDRDPAWPVLAAQLATGSRTPAEPVGAALATLAASVAALQVLCHLDGGRPETLGGSLELGPTGGTLRRRSWPPHPRCGCRSPARSTG